MNKKLIASILWITSLQYFIVQVLVASAYAGQFSWAHNTISDLGNTACAVYIDRYVCSPQHMLMNISFIALGAAQLFGALLLYLSNRNHKTLIGFGLSMLAGIGTIIVGLFPENTVGLVHGFGAALPFLLGNIAILILAGSLNFPRWLKYYSYLSGVVALTALVLFVTKTYLEIGLGGMERVVAYPQTIWMIVVGSYFLLRNK